jgi:hypothetical protein
MLAGERQACIPVGDGRDAHIRPESGPAGPKLSSSAANLVSRNMRLNCGPHTAETVARQAALQRRRGPVRAMIAGPAGGGPA